MLQKKLSFLLFDTLTATGVTSFLFLPQLWFRRSRLSSVRTLPERSEFRASVREAEVREEVLQTRSLHRSRLGSEKSHHIAACSRPRKLSTASSPSSYKVWTAEEEEELDHYGYVLPGSPGTPERGKIHSKHNSVLFYFIYFALLLSLCITASRISRSGKRNTSQKNNLRLMLSNPSQEYETMNTESTVPTCSPLLQGDDPLITVCHKVTTLPSPTLMDLSLTEKPQETPICASHVAHEGALGEQKDLAEKHHLISICTGAIISMDDQAEVGEGVGRYEYMDIRHSDSSEGGDPELQRSWSETSVISAAETCDTEDVVGVVEEEQKGQEAENHHNADETTRLQGSLSSTPGPDVPTAGGGKVEEYEEMTGLGEVPNGWGCTEYENLPVKERAAPEDVGGARCAGIEEYIKVCAGIGEPGSSTSFDNPDYWHSRLFLKPDAVRT